MTFLIDIFTNNGQLRVKEKKNTRKSLQKAYHEKHLTLKVPIPDKVKKLS